MKPETCFTCMGVHDPLSACTPVRSDPTDGDFPARYRSECGDCWDEIHPGDMIIGSDNGYVHEECALKEDE